MFHRELWYFRSEVYNSFKLSPNQPSLVPLLANKDAGHELTSSVSTSWLSFSRHWPQVFPAGNKQVIYGHDSVPFKLRPLWLFETENSSEESRDSIICIYARFSSFESWSESQNTNFSANPSAQCYVMILKIYLNLWTYQFDSFLPHWGLKNSVVAKPHVGWFQVQPPYSLVFKKVECGVAKVRNLISAESLTKMRKLKNAESLIEMRSL